MKLFKYLISAILLLGIFSCEEYNYSDGVLDTLPRKLTLDKTSVEFVEGEKSLTREVVVTSENISWAITGVPDWLEVSPLEGGSGTTAVKLTASKLPVGDKRNAVIKLESLVPKFKYSHEIKVSQGVDLEFGISATLLSFENTAGEKSIAVTTNISWEAECEASWVVQEKSEDGSLIVSVEENKEPVVRRTKINIKQLDKDSILSTIEIEQRGAPTYSNSHEYIDLGLPSGLKWATCNVGATSPEEYGDYYAWGETSHKSSYDENNSVTYGVTMGDISGDNQYDAARANWGGDWRMPTDAEFKELIDNCVLEWIASNGINGIVVTGKNGNSIFLPAAGCKRGASLSNSGASGAYWSSTPKDNVGYYSNCFDFGNTLNSLQTYKRGYGMSIRPVLGGSYFTITENLNAFEAVVGSENVEVSTNISWKAECDASWVTFEKNGDMSLTVSVEENETFEERTATITFKRESTGDVLGSVSVKQSKATFELQPVSLEFGNTSSNKTVAVTTNISWAAECDASWVTIEKNGDTSLTVSVEENEAFEERTATIIFKREATGEVLGSIEVKQAAAVPNINGHEYVDLGLPSGIKWAACNVGASKPEEYGDYFAWGETSPKSSYSSSNSVTYGKSMSDIGGDAQYDAARANRGGDWRLPTKAEFAELLNSSNCTWTWTTQNGVNGYKVTSVRNGSSIFLPAAGYRDGTSLNNGGSGGYYWSSTPFESNDGYSYDLFFYSGRHSTDWHSRNDGRSVRPVSE
ncbi:MAG: hypothetical protein IJY44_07390 [Bacteroidaceae bacterium]|nr:hypothetical protein [Bacteroidaceae bacterium]